MTPDQISKVIDDLMVKYGPAGQHVYEVLYRQVIIENAAWAILSGVVLLGLVRIYWRSRTAIHADLTDGGNGELILPLIIGGSIALVTAIILWGAVIALLNPEYAVIQKLVQVVK